MPTDVRGAGAGGARGGERQAPSCDVLAEQWFGEGQAPDDDKAGAVYHARLQYPPGAPSLPTSRRPTGRRPTSGPKERDVLANAAGGWARLQDLINLGTFSIVAKWLVVIITWIHANMTGEQLGHVSSMLTVGLRMGGSSR